MRLYLDHLNEWAGEEPEYHLLPAEEDEPPVLTFTYRGQFGPNTIAGFTYGLSLVSHPEWRLARPELFIGMASGKEEWVLAAGHVAAAWRGEKRYRTGDIFDLGAPISPDESEMSAVLLFLATDLDPEFTRVELPDRTVVLAQLYPLHESEMALVERKGPAEFLSTENVDFHDPRRPPLSP
jgi:hypothetical protein